MRPVSEEGPQSRVDTRCYISQPFVTDVSIQLYCRYYLSFGFACGLGSYFIVTPFKKCVVKEAKDNR